MLTKSFSPDTSLTEVEHIRAVHRSSCQLSEARNPVDAQVLYLMELR